jgi:basic membrane protein A
MKRCLPGVLLFFLLAPAWCAGENVVGFLIPVSGLGDQSFNDMTYAGLIQAKNEYQFTLIREQCDDFSDASREKAMARLIERGAGIIVVNGWEFQDLVTKYAKTNRDRFFIINDFPLPGLANVASTVFGQHEGSYLAGSLAGLMTKTGRVGFIGGMDMPVIRAFLVGFAEGVRSVRADIDIKELFLEGEDSEISGFNNPAVGFEKASSLYDQGVDIIFSVAGLSGNGIIRAAAARKLFVIGVDADQDHMAKGYVLTSVVKRLDRATYLMVQEALEGRFVPGIHTFNLKNDGVSLTAMAFTRHLIPDEVLVRLETARKEIIEGKRKVTDYLVESGKRQ